MAGDIKYSLSVAVEGAIQQLDRFSNKIKKVNDDFSSITAGAAAMAAGLSAALGGVIASAAAFADEMSDVAAANETTVASILGLSSALAGAGGSADNAGRMLQTLSNNIDAANSGNLKMLYTFQKMGVTIEELGSKSSEAIRNELIKAIADINDPAERSAKAMEMFGKSAVGVDFKALAADIDEQTAKYAAYELQVKNAGDAFDSMAKIFKDIKVAATVAFEPLFKFIKDLKIDIDVLVIVLRAMAAALAAAVSVSVLAGFAKLITMVKTLTVVARANPLIAIASAALGIASALGVWDSATADVETSTANLNEEMTKSEEKASNVKRDQTDTIDAIKKQKEALSQITENFDKQLKQLQNKFKLEGDALSLSEEQKKITQELANIEQQKENTLYNLKQKYESLDASSRAARASDYDKEKKLIETNAEVAKRKIEEQIRDNQRYQESLKALQTFIKEVNDVNIKRFELLSKQMMDNAGYREKIDLEQKLSALTKLRTSLTEGLSNLSAEEKAQAEAAIIAATTHTANLKTGYDDINKSVEEFIKMMVKEKMITEEVGAAILKSNIDVRPAILQNAKDMADMNKEIMNNSRTFSFGWNKALAEYTDNATNAAQTAQRVFQKAMQGMEDAIVNFVKTGKFEWKNFVNMMLEELLRSQIRNVMAQLFSANASSVRGGGSFLGGLLGFANGGIIPTNAPVLVGERGPEIIAGASGRQVIPNNQLGGTSIINYNISAVDAMSFKQMIAADPSFIHAVAMQGSRGAPIRR